MLLLAAIATASSTVIAAPQAEFPAEKELISRTLLDYIEGSTNGQPDRLRKAFHPDLNLYSIRKNQLRVWSGKDYIKDTKRGEPTGERGRILSIDFENDAAVAKVEVSHPKNPRSYIDYFMLLKIKGKWTIIHKMFTQKTSVSQADGSRESGRSTLTVPVSIGQLAGDIDKAVLAVMEANHLPGVAVVVVQNGRTIIKRGFGVANIAHNTDVDPDKTIFRIGSISKALTLLTLTRLVDAGRVAMTDDVNLYFDGVRNPKNLTKPVTIRNLLTHTTGFDQIGLGRRVHDFHLSLEERKSRRPSLRDFLKANNVRQVSQPGECFRYDTYGTTVAGAVLERVTGKPYAEAMRREMFQPLGMANSFVEVDADHADDLALGYGWVNGRFEAQPYEIYTTTPASSIDATPADMGRLLEALTGDGAAFVARHRGAFLDFHKTERARLTPAESAQLLALLGKLTGIGEDIQCWTRTI